VVIHRYYRFNTLIEVSASASSSSSSSSTRVACTMGVTEETVVAWSCTEVGGTTCVAGASDVAGTRVVA